jgi:hypothetical protein
VGKVAFGGVKLRIIYPLIIIASLLTCIAAYAAVDNIEHGPFKISFELNSQDGYNIEKENPADYDKYISYPLHIRSKATETTDGIETSIASITILIEDHSDVVDVSADELRNRIKENAVNNYIDTDKFQTDYSDFTINGVPGILAIVQPGKLDDGSYLGKQVFFAAYSPDGQENNGHVIVLVRSFYPQDVTEPFLKTLRISKS